MSAFSGVEGFVAYLGEYEEAIKSCMEKIEAEKIVSRLWEKDHTIWSEDPNEISNRLGWLDSPETTSLAIDDVNRFVDGIRAEGFTNILLLGMGGSSLAPEVFSLVFDNDESFPLLEVLDSTDPGAVLSYVYKLPLEKTLFVVSTKSGGTVETLSFMKFFYTKISEIFAPKKAGYHFVAITDPGSGLEAMARELDFRKIFINDPNIGGRYSVLSFFGAVPAALYGVELNRLFDSAKRMAEESKLSGDALYKNTSAMLGAMLGEFALMGKDKVTFVCDSQVTPFAAWVEQLVAESVGKIGKGILPVDGESLLDPSEYSKDRIFVKIQLKKHKTECEKVAALKAVGFPVLELTLEDEYELGGEFFRWEVATAIAGWRMGVQPFDQPNVEQAKVIARDMMKAYQEEGKLPELKTTLTADGMDVIGDVEGTSVGEVITKFLAQMDEGDSDGKGRSYVSLQAYLKPDDATTMKLQELRTAIQKKHHVATTIGYGPRFLHSTGQLHKGDAGHGLFIQFTADMPEDAAIPDEPGKDKSSISFAVLKNAQAMGDRQALLDNKRRVIRFDLKDDIIGGLNTLIQALA